jgi:hypothetical protein
MDTTLAKVLSECIDGVYVCTEYRDNKIMGNWQLGLFTPHWAGARPRAPGSFWRSLPGLVEPPRPLSRRPPVQPQNIPESAVAVGKSSTSWGGEFGRESERCESWIAVSCSLYILYYNVTYIVSCCAWSKRKERDDPKLRWEQLVALTGRPRRSWGPEWHTRNTASD